MKPDSLCYGIDCSSGNGQTAAPDKFSFKPTEWLEWIEDFGRYRRAAKLHKEDRETQWDTLFDVMGGRQANKSFITLKFEMKTMPDPRDRQKVVHVKEKDTDYDTLVQKLTEYFVPKCNTIHESGIFQ